jgi:hypothetical protein
MLSGDADRYVVIVRKTAQMEDEGAKLDGFGTGTEYYEDVPHTPVVAVREAVLSVGEVRARG